MSVPPVAATAAAPGPPAVRRAVAVPAARAAEPAPGGEGPTKRARKPALPAPLAAEAEPPGPARKRSQAGTLGTHAAGQATAAAACPGTAEPPGAAAKKRRKGGQEGSLQGRFSKVATAYLTAHMFDDGWAASSTDIGHLLKAPMAMLELGQMADAREALLTAARHVGEREELGMSSANATYATLYPQYPFFCLCWAAAQLGDGILARKCYSRIAQFVHPVTGSGLVASPYVPVKPFEADFLATALAAKAALLVGDYGAAVLSGESLLRALEVNRRSMAADRFWLRWSWANGLVETEDPLHCVSCRGAGQLYFMLGVPAGVLLELASLPAASTPTAAAFLDGGMELLAFVQRCRGLSKVPKGQRVPDSAAKGQDEQTMARIVEDFVSVPQKRPANASCREGWWLSLTHLGEMSMI